MGGAIAYELSASPCVLASQSSHHFGAASNIPVSGSGIRLDSTCVRAHWFFKSTCCRRCSACSNLGLRIENAPDSSNTKQSSCRSPQTFILHTAHSSSGLNMVGTRQGFARWWLENCF